MKLRRLGSSGLKVSEIVLGCMSYGDPVAGSHEWTLPWERARPFFVEALEAGITTFDTADMYSLGGSEEIVGRAVRELARREDVVIATKVYSRMRESEYSGGLSRKHLLNAIEESLTRLGTDYVDLYQVHRFDPDTPVEETMEALHDIVRAGKARYIGASSMHAWQFAKMQYTADLAGWTRFISMQDQYNLIQREEEREMHAFCLDQGIGVLPWSPLARGKLTRPWGEQTARSRSDAYGRILYGHADDRDQAIVGAVHRVAANRGVSVAQIALAWVRQQPAVTAPIVGATKVLHLTDAVDSLDIELTADELDELDSPYLRTQSQTF